MATIPELLDGHITLEVECLDRLYLNGYIGKLATGLGLSMFMRDQLGKPVPSPVVLGQVSERFRQAVKALAEREGIPIYQFDHQERKDDIANKFRQQRPVRDGIVFIGVAQEKAKTFNGKKVNGWFEFVPGQDGLRQSLLLLHRRRRLRAAVHQDLQLCAVEHEAVPERARMGQAATGEKEDRLRGFG